MTITSHIEFIAFYDPTTFLIRTHYCKKIRILLLQDPSRLVLISGSITAITRTIPATIKISSCGVANDHQ